MKPTEPKKILCIHDLSGMGRCSLAVILPVLSVMGCQPVALPTVVLSTHTGGLGTPARLDGAAYGLAALKHYREMGVEFDCIYTGYLGGEEQVALAEKAFDLWPAARKVVDPVMGDNGDLYSSIPETMIPQMRKLIGKADIIVPNYTEAAMLLGREMERQQTDEELKEWLRELADLGPGTVMITSAPDMEKPEMMNVIAYERESGTYWKVASRLLHDYYPGTGDVFASVLIGSLLRGESLPEAIDWAAQFVSQCIKVSSGYDYERRDGVQLERVLPLLHQDHLVNGYERF